MIHWRSLTLKWRSRWIVGSATFTTVASRTTMNCATQTMARTSQRLGSDRIGGPRYLEVQRGRRLDRHRPEPDGLVDVPHDGVLLRVRRGDHVEAGMVGAQAPQRLGLDGPRETETAVLAH